MQSKERQRSFALNSVLSTAPNAELSLKLSSSVPRLISSMPPDIRNRINSLRMDLSEPPQPGEWSGGPERKCMIWPL